MLRLPYLGLMWGTECGVLPSASMVPTRGQSEHFPFDQSKTLGYREAPGVGSCIEEIDDVPVSSLLQAMGTLMQYYSFHPKCMSNGFLKPWGRKLVSLRDQSTYHTETR